MFALPDRTCHAFEFLCRQRRVFAFLSLACRVFALLGRLLCVVASRAGERPVIAFLDRECWRVLAFFGLACRVLAFLGFACRVLAFLSRERRVVALLGWVRRR